ncbi:hypothetical protein [Mucilaginibacter rubeus]|uniref:Uncharacterized protein n=1 Tax=Mucilaginibacter rubeus TaxID=2027860 RepID=A0A5C1I8T1_9SPHI|nr:hypothetical protein [Mucilaginibacter rubeus]QEM13998.1 hypothetical protein DEO27_029615 [Mucilaginibacter rubeus]
MLKFKIFPIYGKLTLALSFVLILAVIVGSCKKDFSSSPQVITDPAINKAKTWYEGTYLANQGNLAVQATNTNTDWNQRIKPDWQHPDSYTKLNKNVIEMPVDPGSKFSSGLKVGKYSLNKKYSRSYFLLLNDGNKYEAYVMMVIADSAYVGSNLSKLGNNTYHKHDDNFGGLVLYFTPQGNYLNGYCYKNGKLVTKTSDQSGGRQKVQSTSVNKLTPDLTQAPTNCTDWYIDTYVDDVLVSSDYIGTTCDEGDPNTGGGGGGGGSTTPPPTPCNPAAAESVNNTGTLQADGVQVQKVQPIDGGGGFPPPGGEPCPHGGQTTSQTITNNVKNPCLRSMVDQTIVSGVSTQINSLIKGVFGESTTINLAFEDVNTLPSYADGATLPNDGIVNGALDASIQLNVNLLPNYSQEYIARVIMHEALHAYMDSQGIVADEQHESMIINYVSKMASSLRVMFPNLTEVDAKNLSLGGLQLTDSFRTQIQNDMKLSGDFAAINSAYSVGSLGTRCH